VQVNPPREKTVEQLTRDVEKLQQMYTELKASSAAGPASAQTIDLADTRQFSEAELKAHLNAQAQLQEHQRSLTELKQELDEAKKVCEETKKALQQKEQELSLQQEEHTQEKRNYESVNRSLESRYEQCNAKREREKSDYEQHIGNLQRRIAELERNLECQIKERELQVEKAMMSNRREVAELQEQLKDAKIRSRNDREDLEETKSRYQAELDMHARRISELNARQHSIREEYARKMNPGEFMAKSKVTSRMLPTLEENLKLQFELKSANDAADWAQRRLNEELQKNQKP